MCGFPWNPHSFLREVSAKVFDCFVPKHTQRQKHVHVSIALFDRLRASLARFSLARVSLTRASLARFILTRSQFGAFQFGAMPVWRVSLWRVSHFLCLNCTEVFLRPFGTYLVLRLKPCLQMAQFKRARPGTEPGSVPGPDTRLFTLSGPGTAPTRSSIWPPSICVMSCVC